MDGLTVVLPTLNEATNLPHFLPALAEACGRLPFPSEILIVDDASPDGTAEVARGLSASLPVPLRILARTGARSLSASVVEGARAARYGTIAVLDSDLSHDPLDLEKLVPPVREARADVVIGSRYTKGGRVSSWPRRRRLLSRLGTASCAFLTRVSDPLSGYFACRRSLLSGSTPLKPRGYKILLEILGRHPGLTVLEVPTSFVDRSSGESKLCLRQLCQFGVQVASLMVHRMISKFPGKGFSKSEGFTHA